MRGHKLSRHGFHALLPVATKHQVLTKMVILDNKDLFSRGFKNPKQFTGTVKLTSSLISSQNKSCFLFTDSNEFAHLTVRVDLYNFTFSRY